MSGGLHTSDGSDGGDGADDAVARARAAQALIGRIADLVEKYRMLEALRRGAPGRTIERRDAIRAVAARFPAAMREWDEAPLEEIVRRREEVEGTLAALLADLDGGAGRAMLAAPERAWIRFAAEVHERLRAALRVKRWLAGRPLTDELAGDAERAFAIDRARLDAIATPEGGRIAEAVYREVAALHGVAVAELKAALFPRR
ncbi:MAG: hypothetical protein EXR72_25485 [Myxococcales bacterium]|nr:hypothetical protein [Myxococcales bacterium]